MPLNPHSPQPRPRVRPSRAGSMPAQATLLPAPSSTHSTRRLSTWPVQLPRSNRCTRPWRRPRPPWLPVRLLNPRRLSTSTLSRFSTRTIPTTWLTCSRSVLLILPGYYFGNCFTKWSNLLWCIACRIRILWKQGPLYKPHQLKENQHYCQIGRIYVFTVGK